MERITLSSLSIVPVPVSLRSVVRVPMAVAVLSEAVKVSLSSTVPSSVMATVTVLFAVSSAAKVTWSAL